jgi:hypothetical protein
MTSRVRRVDPFLAAAALLPGVGLAALWALGLYATTVLGHWPHPYRDDPKYLSAGTGWLAPFAMLLLTTAILSPLAIAADLLVRRVAHAERRPALALLVVFAACYAALWLQLFADPGQLFAWLAD